MKGQLIGAGVVPGLPHLLDPKSEAGRRLAAAYRELAERIEKLNPDVLMVYSTQWLSVLGTSFQTRAQLKGKHVDENWHELGALPYDFSSDASLAMAMAEATGQHGFPTKLIDYDEFPIDTGTIVALSFLNSEKKRPVAIMSSWVYADEVKNVALGAAAREAALHSGKKVFALAITSLSTRYFTTEISPAEDRISDSADDARNQQLLGALETGRLVETSRLVKAFSAEMPVDMGGAAWHWLRGVCGDEVEAGKVLAYGAVWGTGNAVAQLILKESR